MRPVALTCFFLSGASGLVFEVIWSRKFTLVFDATALAISAVLTAFMGGLALGSYLSSRIADRVKDPLKAYALAEAGIGFSALLVPVVVLHFDSLNQYVYQHFYDSPMIRTAARFVASFAVMLVPTTLMGATLPLLSRLFVKSELEHARVGLRVGTLYAVNTFGALLGTTVAGFVLLGWIGENATNTVAACMNLALAGLVAVAYFVKRRRPPPSAQAEEARALLESIEPIDEVRPEVPALVRRIVLPAFAVSGAVAMVYQVLWTRALFITIGSSVYSFTIVLTAFLLGLAGGAAIISRLTATSRHPARWLVAIHLGVVAGALLPQLLMDKLPFIYLFFLKGANLDASVVLRTQLLIALLAMLPATLAMGGVLPLTIRIYSVGVDHVGADVGRAYSVNTIGAIIGSFAAGFIILPVCQLQPGLYFALCVNLALAALFYCATVDGHSRTSRRGIAVAATVALIVWGLALPRWNLTHVTSGVFRLAIARDVLQSGEWTDPTRVFYADGVSTTVSVERWKHNQYSLKNNGKVDASTGEDMATQITVGLLPVLMHPQTPERKVDVVLIGYASGVTAGSILQGPVKRLDVVELERNIIKASVFFEHVNNRPLDDKRLHLWVDDGRNFLQAGKEPYDVIINEPSNPWITGVSNLFTREYFEIGKRRLRPEGVFCTWAQLYEIGPRRVKSIYRTFAEVFPYAYSFSAEPLSSDTFLIGSKRPLTFDIQRMRRAFALPTVKREFERAGVKSPNDLLALTLLGPGEIRPFTVGASLNTDDNAYVEFRAPLDLYNHKKYDYYVSRIYSQTWMYGHLDRFAAGYQTSEDHADLVWGLLRSGRFREAKHRFQRVQKDAGPRSGLVHTLVELLGARETDDEEVTLSEGDGGALDPPRAVVAVVGAKMAERVAREYYLVEQHAKRRLFRSALDLIEAWPDSIVEEAGNDFQLLWGYLVYKCSDFHTAVKILEPLHEKPNFVKQRPALLYYLGRSYYGNADFKKAIRALEAWTSYRAGKGQPPVPPLQAGNSASINVTSD